MVHCYQFGKRDKIDYVYDIGSLEQKLACMYHGISTRLFDGITITIQLYFLLDFLCFVYVTFTCWNSRNVKDFHCCVLD